MRVGVYNYHQGRFQTQEMFQNPKLTIGDDLMRPFFILNKIFHENEHELLSVGEKPIEYFDAILFLEWPTLPSLLNPYFRTAKKLKKDLYLLLLESEAVRASNYSKKNHRFFKKIFTWNDSLIDNKKYFKIQIPQNLPKLDTGFFDSDRKLLTLIASHKLSSFPGELYSERIAAIRYFENFQKSCFDLYGNGWGTIRFKNKYIEMVMQSGYFAKTRKILSQYFFNPFISWKGSIENKKLILSRYDFAICYENVENISGYITEKIFDCFYAGCIPVYRGAPNISEFIPENTFINGAKFKDYSTLYNHLRGLSKKDKENYRKNIKLFLENNAEKFSSEYFSKILLKHITSSYHYDDTLSHHNPDIQ